MSKTKWIEFDGDECPVPGEAPVLIRLRSGAETRRFSEARYYRWTRSESPDGLYDIAAYLVEEPAR